MNFATLTFGRPMRRVQDIADYLAAVERRGVGLKIGCYVGHRAVRLFVMGDDAYQQEAAPDELMSMRVELWNVIQPGAMGFASSTASTHNGDHGRPVPSRLADLDEVRFLALTG